VTQILLWNMESGCEVDIVKHAMHNLEENENLINNTGGNVSLCLLRASASRDLIQSVAFTRDNDYHDALD
jgi:hypothetical protein